jgi:hypothetical protein
MDKYWTASRQYLLERVGSIEQLAPVRRVAFVEGRAKSVEAIEVQTGSGLSLVFIVDRTLDLAEARWCGRSLCWQSNSGIVAPTYYERSGMGWLRGFLGGMLTTCGLRNVGPPLEDKDETFGLHGEIAYTPAINASSRMYWKGDRYCIAIAGEIREAHAFGPNLKLQRTWRTELGADWVELEDVVTNEGFRDELHMQLYHWNFGFPFLSERSRLYLTTNTVEPRDKDAGDVQRWAYFDPPTRNYTEQVFFHSYTGSRRETSSALVVSNTEEMSLAVLISYATSELPELVQWKMCGQGDYVLGIEPANCRVIGRQAHRVENPTYLAPGQSRRLGIRLAVLTDPVEIQARLDLHKTN